MNTIKILTVFFCLVPFLSFSQVIETTAINVEGYLQETPQDDELNKIKAEVERQKKEIALQKVKSKSFRELSKSTTQLSDVTEQYIEEKKAAQKQIAEYNLKVQCMQEDFPGKECERFIRKK
jgi:septal ring factor EnvC (AmiA/AmiB activator)